MNCDLTIKNKIEFRIWTPLTFPFAAVRELPHMTHIMLTLTLKHITYITNVKSPVERSIFKHVLQNSILIL